MKPISDQSFYERLDLAPQATAEEVEAAWHRAVRQYGPGSLATYMLGDPGEAERLFKYIEEAYRTLSDPGLRRAYDALLQGPPAPAQPEPVAAPAVRQLSFDTLLDAARVYAWPGSRPDDGDLAPAPALVSAPRIPLVGAEPSGAAAEPARESPPRADATAPSSTLAEAPGPTAARGAEGPPVVVAPSPPPKGPEPVGEPARGHPALRPDEVSALLARGGEPGHGGEALSSAAPQAAEAVESARLRQAQRPEAERAPLARPAPRPPEIGPTTIFNGELLRQVRVGRGIELRELAERTKINATHLENIEADRYAALPVAVYLRGFLMSVARELRLDPLKVSKAYLDLVARAKAPKE